VDTQADGEEGHQGQGALNIYELYGRQAEELERTKGQLIKTLTLLKLIKDDEVNIKDVEVTEKGWEVKEESGSTTGD